MSAVSYLQSKVTGAPNSTPSFPSSDSTYRPPPVGGGFGSNQGGQGGGYGGGYGGGGGNHSSPGYGPPGGFGSNSHLANQGRRWGHHPPREEPKEEELSEPAPRPDPPKPPPPMVDLLDMDDV